MQAHHLPRDEVCKLVVEQHGLAVTTCGVAVDKSQQRDFNGIVSPPPIGSPSSALTTASPALSSQMRISPYDSAVNISHGDGLESDEDVPEPEQPKDIYDPLMADEGDFSV